MVRVMDQGHQQAFRVVAVMVPDMGEQAVTGVVVQKVLFTGHLLLQLIREVVLYQEVQVEVL